MTMIDPTSKLISPTVKAAIIANTPMTATKANIGALVPAFATIILYVIGRLTGAVELPSGSELSGAIIAIVTAVVMYGAGWVAIYLPANTPKLYPAALALATLATVLVLAGCASSQDAQRQRLASMASALTVADAVVSVYSLQPACDDAPKGVLLCSQPMTVYQLRLLLASAKAAVYAFSAALNNPATGDTLTAAAATEADGALAKLSAETSKLKAD